MQLKSESSFDRFVGQLEKNAPESEPLPPTPITPEAKRVLESWGVPEQYVDWLQNLVSSFRYDLCPQKVERLVPKGAYLVPSMTGEKLIFLPDFLQHQLHFDGQCADITLQLLQLLHSTNFLSQLNEVLTQQNLPKILPYYFECQSRTHFNGKNMKHIGLGLLPEGQQLDEMIVVDASFQEISSVEENEYQLGSVAQDPQNFSRVPTTMELHIGSCQGTSRESFTAHCKPSAVLGISNDRTLIYSLGFLETPQKKIVPFIQIFRKNGTERRKIFLFDEQKQLLVAEEKSTQSGSFSENSGVYAFFQEPAIDPELQETHLAEIMQMLQSLERMRFVDVLDLPQDQIDQILSHHRSVQFRKEH